MFIRSSAGKSRTCTFVGSAYGRIRNLSIDSVYARSCANQRDGTPPESTSSRELEDFIRVALDTRKASSGDTAARERLARALRSELDFHDQSLGVSLLQVKHVRKANESYQQKALAIPEQWWSERIAVNLSAKLTSVRPHVWPVRPGTFEVRLMGVTLLEFCYLSVANALAKEPLSSCPECARVFVLADKRQKVCEPKCAGRARFRAYSERQAKKTAGMEKPVQKGAHRHGKTTRTR